jgi:hypothetical protein
MARSDRSRSVVATTGDLYDPGMHHQRTGADGHRLNDRPLSRAEANHLAHARRRLSREVKEFPACAAGDLVRVEGHILALARKVADSRADGRDLEYQLHETENFAIYSGFNSRLPGWFPAGKCGSRQSATGQRRRC